MVCTARKPCRGLIVGCRQAGPAGAARPSRLNHGLARASTARRSRSADGALGANRQAPPVLASTAAVAALGPQGGPRAGEGCGRVGQMAEWRGGVERRGRWQPRAHGPVSTTRLGAGTPSRGHMPRLGAGETTGVRARLSRAARVSAAESRFGASSRGPRGLMAVEDEAPEPGPPRPQLSRPPAASIEQALRGLN